MPRNCKSINCFSLRSPLAYTGVNPPFGPRVMAELALPASSTSHVPLREPVSWKLPRKLRRRGCTIVGHCRQPCGGFCGYACGRPLARGASREHRHHMCLVCHRLGPSPPQDGNLPWRLPLRVRLSRSLRAQHFVVRGWCSVPCARGCGFACSKPLGAPTLDAPPCGHSRHVCSTCRPGVDTSGGPGERLFLLMPLGPVTGQGAVSWRS